MNHCKAVSVPIMMVLGIKPFQRPLKPRALADDVKVDPLALFM